MRRALLFSGLLLVGTLAGCRSAAGPAPDSTPSATAETAPRRAIVLAGGTPVRLVLLDELTSGGSEKGMPVRLALAEAVDGLPAMSPVSATVAWSRTEGSLGGLTNRPARLTLKLENLTGPNGEAIPLSADPKEEKEFELNRANTGRPELGDPGEESAAAQEAVRELIAKGESGGLDAKEVGDLARRLGMGETAKLADAGRLREAQDLIRTVRGGGSVAALATGGPVAAALELVNLAGDVSSRLGRRLGGRNIRAYPGTVIEAYVARETTIAPR